MTAIGDVAVSRQEKTAVVDWGRYQVDHLFVLVGGNPLPNAVAARLLVAPGSTVHLVHTPRSAPVATRLGRWLSDRRQLRVVHHTVGPETSEIVAAVTPVVTPLAGQRVGLHYTGGTKRMAVHAYDAVAAALAKADPHAWFSYLDARTLTMRLHRADVHAVQDVAVEPAGLAVSLDLRELIHGLQGWNLPYFSTAARLAGSAAALRQIHMSAEGQGAWKQWLDQTQGHDPLTLPGDEQLLPVATELRREFGLGPDQQLPRDFLVKAFDLRKIYPRKSTGELREEAFKWLQGKWLEAVTLRALLDRQQALDLHDVGANLEPRRKHDDGSVTKFEFDVAATRGYQLFAFSCYAGDWEAKAQRKLFEACVRARQMGGDEACVALICCADDTAAVEAAARDAFGVPDDGSEPRIKVFGRADLVALPARLDSWIRACGSPAEVMR